MSPNPTTPRPGRAPRSLSPLTRLLAVPLLLPLAACGFIEGNVLAAQCDVTGDLVVEEAGSGSLEIERVAGRLSIEE